MKQAVIIAFIATFTATPLTSEAHEFTDKNGKTLEAEVVAVTAKKVVIRRSDSRTFTVPITTFIDEDQAFIEEWRKKDQDNRIPKLEISVLSRRGDRFADDGDYDNRNMKLRFKVEIQNRERNFDLREAKATLVVLGEDVLRRGSLKVIYKEKIPFSVPEGQTVAYDCKEIFLKYDDNDAAKFGHKYYGYVLVVQTKTGKTIATKSIPSGLAQYGEAALKIRMGATTKRDLGSKK